MISSAPTPRPSPSPRASLSPEHRPTPSRSLARRPHPSLALFALASALAACSPHADAPPAASQTAATSAPLPPATLGGTNAAGTPGAESAPGAAGTTGATGAADAAGATGPTGATGGADAGVSPSGEVCASSIDEAALAPVLKAVGEALAKRDGAALAKQAHPTKGVRFSPYASVDKGSDVVLKPGELGSALTNPKTRTWGSYDGSGAPIKLTFAKYFQAFVYDKDFVRLGTYSRGRTLQTGNTTSNLCESYPGAAFVEYHMPGTDPRYGGMDWASLRLVFEASAGKVYLVGVVHDQWTI